VKSIWVIAVNNGVEGHSGPVQAFLTEKEAMAARALIDTCAEVFVVPVWPEPAQPWYYIKAVKVFGSRESVPSDTPDSVDVSSGEN
jgi:hypothetical protein